MRVELADIIIKFLSSEKLWTTIIGTFTGGLFAYLFNLNLQKIKEKSDNHKKQEIDKKKNFTNLKTTLFSLERNARHLKASKILFTEHNRENASNTISPYLDNRSYHQELDNFLDSEEINLLYFIEYGFKEIISKIDLTNEIKKESFKSLLLSDTLNKEENYLKKYLNSEEIINKDIITIIDPLIIHIKIFCDNMERYMKNEFPEEKIQPINWDFMSSSS